MSDRSVRVFLSALVAPYVSSIGQATASTRVLEGQVLSTQKSAKVSQGALMAMGKGSMLALGGAGVAAYGFVKAVSAATESNIAFESSFAGIRKTVDATEEEFAELEEEFRRLATEIPVSVNELNRIGELGGQLGIAKENLVDFTRTIAMMGVATDLTTDEAATKMAQFAEVTGMPVEQVSNLASAIVDLGNKGATTEPVIMEYAARIAGAGEIAGMTEADIVGLGAAMGNIGVPAEAGGTAVQKAILTITESVALGDEKLEKFAETSGMSADQFARKWRRDPAAAFTAFVEGLGDAGQDGIAILKDLGLTDQRLTRAFLSLGAAGDVLTDSIATSNEAFAENNALQEEAEKRFETTEMRIQLAKNQIEDLKIAWGEWSAQTLGDGAQALTDVMQVQNRYNDQLGDTVNLLTQLGDQYTRGTTSADEFINVAMKQVEGLEGFTDGSVSSVTELREALERMTSDIESDTLFERLGRFGRAEAGELRFEQADAVLELVRAMETGVPILEDGTNALGMMGAEAEETGNKTKGAGKDVEQAVSSFERLFETDKDFRDWRDSASGALEDLSGEFSELADESNVTATELIEAFRRQREAVANFKDNLNTLITRGAKPALIKDLIDMGEEGARWAAALAGANEQTLEAFVRARRGAETEMDGLTGAVRRAAGSVESDAGRMTRSMNNLTSAIQGVPREVAIRIVRSVETTGTAKQPEDFPGQDSVDRITQSALSTSDLSRTTLVGGGDRAVQIVINGGNPAEVRRVVIDTIRDIEHGRSQITRARTGASR